jgi:hypothetical protein
MLNRAKAHHTAVITAFLGDVKNLPHPFSSTGEALFEIDNDPHFASVGWSSSSRLAKDENVNLTLNRPTPLPTQAMSFSSFKRATLR